jgi:hypothetical protein
MSFAVAKIASFLPFVVVTEWYRRHNPHFARQATRAAIVVYVVTYVVITAGVNIA